MRDRLPLLDPPIEAARARFRPILMTSPLAFILGAVPLVVAIRAGASAVQVDRHHRVLGNDRPDSARGGVVRTDVSLVVQRFENWLAERKQKVPDAQTVSRAGS